MEYRSDTDKIYVRLDRGDEIMESLMDICKKEGVKSALFRGIGACSDAVVGTYIDEKREFMPHVKKDTMLEMISLMGDIVTDDQGEMHEHAHAMFAYLDGEEVRYFGGHLLKAVTLYTAEIALEPVKGGTISYQKEPTRDLNVWKFGW